MSHVVHTYKKVAVVVVSPKISEALKVIETPLVEPKDDEVLIKNMYAGVNATDILLSVKRKPTAEQQLPLDIGFDALGVVQVVGKNVSQQFKAGQPVFVLAAHPKSYAEYVYAKPEEIVCVPEVKPEFISIRSGMTAAIGLDRACRIEKGDKVLITSASGGAGHICVQLAKLKGCHTIGLSSSTEKGKLLKELGCDRVINNKREDIDNVLRAEYPSGVDVIWETYGGRVCETLFKHLAPKGRFIIVGGVSGYRSVGFPQISVPINPNELLAKNQSLVGYTYEGYNELYKEYSKYLIQLIVDKKLRIVLDNGLKAPGGHFKGIESVVRAVEYLDKTLNMGKVVIKIDKN